MRVKLENFNQLKNEITKIVEESYEKNLEDILEKYREFKINNLNFFKYKDKRIKLINYKDIIIEVEFITSKCIVNKKEYKEGDILNIVAKKEELILNILSINKEIYSENNNLHYVYSPLLDYWNASIIIDDNFYNRATLINNKGFYQLHLVKENKDGSTYKCVLTEDHIFELEYFKHKKEIHGTKVENFYLDNKIPKLR